ncbi:MAG: Na+/H+ antiporter NhaA [Deltaproteobacteria bacterium]|nr:Na+/H+ antiporter NhaA [Deltaproteobacteria bacterium]
MSVPDREAIDHPPGAWPPARRAVLRMVRPLERFLHVETSSGVILLVAALVAILLANSPWHDAYERLWELPIGLQVGGLALSTTPHFIINDVLMVVFFFVVGLEIRRETHGGELSEARRAILPVAAAIGGMIMPALAYLVVNDSPATRGGWGIPMATDIAFAVGVLALLGKRVPTSLRVLLLALAIIDDIGAILLIAVFYSSGVQLAWLGLAALGLLVVLAMQRVGVRQPIAYVPGGFLVWVGFLKAGIHPTLAGVVLGLMTPARAWLGAKGFLSSAEDAMGRVRSEIEQGRSDRSLLAPLGDIARARREAVAPAVRLEAALHPWVAFGVMPLFALANAGVPLGGTKSANVAFAVLAGLLIGKPLGVLAGSLLVTKLKLVSLPRGVTWAGLLVVGLVAGIGFTMALFISGLAFDASDHLNAAKAAVLGGSVLAAVASLVVGRVALTAPRDEG